MGVISIGEACIDRAVGFSTAFTVLAVGNPANLSGYITTVEVWFSLSCNGIKIGTFYGSGSTYTCRDYATANVASGYVSIPDLHIRVEQGDLIGIWSSDGVQIDVTTSGGQGIKYKSGDQFNAGTVSGYTTTLTTRVISLHGTGLTGRNNAMIF
jgi:hypothetical protein